MLPVVERPWNGPDATTGHTMAELLKYANESEARPACKAAAIAYGLDGTGDPAYIANVIEGAFTRFENADTSPADIVGAEAGRFTQQEYSNAVIALFKSPIH
jgi:hypothetical protein